jgi:Phage stabilisation protein
MAGKPYVECCGPSYHLADRKAGIQSAINCYPKRLQGNDLMMAATPGEVAFADLSAYGPIRGMHYVDNDVIFTTNLYVVAGSKLLRILVDGTVIVVYDIVELATGYPTTYQVSMAHNRTQLVIAGGASLYILNLISGVMTVIDSAGTPAWQGSRQVCELDGYFIFVKTDPTLGDQFYISAIDNGTVLNALDFSSADSSPDDIVAHRVSHRQLWLFGTRSTEIWINDGNAAFPFVRYNSYTLDIGCVGRHAAINAADTLFWVGQTNRGTGIVYMAAGNQPQRISTQAVEEALKTSTDLSAATMWTYQIEGHEFIGINAPGLTTTWVYDAAMQQWHERGEWTDDGWQPLRSRLVTAIRGQHYAGDINGKIVRLDDSTHTLSGRVLVRERTWPHLIKDSLEPTTVYGLELAMSSGAGGAVTLQISTDGGKNFGPMLSRSLGATGRWMQRIRWLGLGTAINRVFRIRCADPVPFAIHSAALDA